MSFNKLDNLYDELQNIINDSQSDVTNLLREITLQERELEKLCKM